MNKYMLAIGFVIFVANIFAFAGGDGTEGNPYQVSTLTELNDVRNYLDSYFIQINDIDASATYGWAGGFDPIGSYPIFTGSYDGQGYSIDSLYICRSGFRIGFFDMIDGAMLSNIRLTNTDIHNMETDGDAGGLVSLMLSGCIMNCGVSGVVSGEWEVGGLVGSLFGGTIGNSFSQVIVSGTGNGRCGGLVGFAQSPSTIENCYARGAVTNTNGLAGGLVGYILTASITNCYSTSIISGSTVGGLIGHEASSSTITASFWDTETSGQSASAGGIGKTTGEMQDIETYFDAGWDFVSETYNGDDDDWDIDLTGAINDGYPYLSWEDGDAQSYVLPAPLGTGTQEDPYIINALFCLQWISDNEEWDKHYRQTADIDASETSTWNGGAGFSRIGTTNNPFTGSYDGQGFSIDNLYINSTSGDMGMFGSTENATLSNIVLTNCYVHGNDGVGGLVGDSNSDFITNCGVSGSVEGDFAIGGLVGRATGSAMIFCYSTAGVTCIGDGDRAGGLVGNFMDNSTISNCYARGGVDGNNKVGGLVGDLNASSIIDSYSAGVVSCSGNNHGGLVGYISDTSTVTDSYWDTAASGQSTSAAGTGLTTAEMTDFYNMYFTTGWDFAAERNHGTDDRWDFDFNGAVNDGYPYLIKENAATLLQPPAGSGASNDPYLIASLFDLFWISMNDNKWNKCYKQTEDIDASDTQNWDNGAGFFPIGTSNSNYFSGSYAGDDHVISNLYINRSRAFVGLFGYARSARINHLSILNADVTGDDHCGIFVGYLYHYTIAHVITSGTVSAPDGFYVGGMCGEAEYVDISDCSSSATVTGYDSVGGLLGGSNGCDTVDSFATGNVTGSTDIGGFVGYQCWNATTQRCYATGDVSGTANYVGGFSGDAVYTSSFLNCYSHGDVSGSNYVGGFAGHISVSSNTKWCYSKGATSGNGNVGGFIGLRHGGVSNCFWDTETSGQSTSAGGTGLTTVEMQTLTPYINAGWDFAGETANGTNDIWVLPPYSYPTLTFNCTAPVITAVGDVPDDQGHQIELVWDACELDTAFNPYRFYAIWRQASGSRATADAVIIDDPADFTVPAEDDTRPVILQDRDRYWVFVETIPASAFPVYGYVAPTLVDSSAALTPAEYTSTYQVIYYFENGYLTSPTADGYSVDNIPPYATDNVRVTVNSSSRNTLLTLSWDEVTQGGLNGNSYPEQNGVWYRVYAGDTPEFVCDESSLQTVTQMTSCDVDITANDRRYFKVVVSDQP